MYQQGFPPGGYPQQPGYGYQPPQGYQQPAPGMPMAAPGYAMPGQPQQQPPMMGQPPRYPGAPSPAAQQPYGGVPPPQAYGAPQPNPYGQPPMGQPMPPPPPQQQQQQPGAWAPAYPPQNKPLPPPQQQPSMPQQQQQYGQMPPPPPQQQQQQQTPPPPGGKLPPLPNWYSQQYGFNAEEAQLRQEFGQLDSDHSGTISPAELAQYRGLGRPIRTETVAKLIKVFGGKAGLIDFQSFGYMTKFIRMSIEAFAQFDPQRRCVIDMPALCEVMKRQGIPVPLPTLEATIRALKPTLPTNQPIMVDLDVFIELATHFALLRSAMEARDPQHQGVIQLNFDAFAQLASEIL